MRTLVFGSFLFTTLALLAAGCGDSGLTPGGDESPQTQGRPNEANGGSGEALVKQSIALIESAASIMDGATDPISYREAEAKLRVVMSQVDKLGAQAATMPQEQGTALAKQFEAQKKAAESRLETAEKRFQAAALFVENYTLLEEMSALLEGVKDEKSYQIASNRLNQLNTHAEGIAKRIQELPPETLNALRKTWEAPTQAALLRFERAALHAEKQKKGS